MPVHFTHCSVLWVLGFTVIHVYYCYFSIWGMKEENKIFFRICLLQIYSLNGKSVRGLDVSSLVDLELYHYRL